MSAHPIFAGILGAMSGDTARACRATGNHRAAQNDEPEPSAQRHLRAVQNALASRRHEDAAITASHREERKAGFDSVGESDEPEVETD